MSALYRPSAFWQELAAEHETILEREGFGEVKRRQALRYFTWQWDWRRLRTSEQFRFLLRHSSWRAFFVSAVEPNHLRRTAWAGVEWPVWDRYLYVLATRLLWRFAARHGDVLTLELGEPTLGSPFPVRAQGQLISQDLANCALEMATIRAALATLPSPHHIVEIGAGYGRTAFVLLSLYPDAYYTVVDIEPALSISQWYLTKLFPDRQLQFLTPDERDRMGGPADLVVSISSLQEMVLDQVADYLQWIDRIAEGGIVYLKQWDRWHNPIDQIEMRFDDYPVPSRWVPISDTACRVQTAFRERVWQVAVTNE